MPKATLAQRKAKPNSRYWREKADSAWSVKIRSIGLCERCGPTERQLNAHHILSRTRLRHRHDLGNGVCLCTTCHAFDATFSPHVDSFSGQGFIEWLETTDHWAWYEANRDDFRQMDDSYRDRYEALME